MIFEIILAKAIAEGLTALAEKLRVMESKIAGAETAGNTGNQILLTGKEWYEYFQKTYGAENVKWMPQSFEHMLENPQALYGATQSEVANILGNGWSLKSYGSAKTGWEFYQNDLRVIYHAADGIHGGEYWGISSGRTGEIKLVGNDYIPTSTDKAIIINMEK